MTGGVATWVPLVSGVVGAVVWLVAVAWWDEIGAVGKRLNATLLNRALVTTIVTSDNGARAGQDVRVTPGPVLVEFPPLFDGTRGALMVAVSRGYRLVFDSPDRRWRADGDSASYIATWDIADDHPITFSAHLVKHRVVRAMRSSGWSSAPGETK